MPSQPRDKFVFYRHIASGKEDNMNMWEWELIQNDEIRRHQFQLLRIVDIRENQVTKAPKSTLEIENDPLECPLCGYLATSEKVLKTHKAKKHDLEKK